ncbi:MAG: lamin tail domain-containing protein [Candidatus Paceibacterota bacterium]|jgi:hypothetical protein
MKIAFSIFAVAAIIFLSISASGGVQPLFANLLSLTEPSFETIDLDAVSPSFTKRTGTATSEEVPKIQCVNSRREETVEKSILLNEIAWMGTNGNIKHEWIELRNSSLKSVDISNWELLDKSKKIQVKFSEGTTIEPGGFYILARGTETIPNVHAHARFSGTINDADEVLTLFSNLCNKEDEIVVGSRWRAGDNKLGRTAERGSNLTWHTSAVEGGTPGKENSIPPTIVSAASTMGMNPLVTPVSSSAVQKEQVTTTPVISSEAQKQEGKVVLSEVMPGKEKDADFEFIELYNDSDTPTRLDGWSLKKRSSTGKESSFIAKTRLQGKTISGHGYLLLASESGYVGTPSADIPWPSSYTLAGTNNAVVLYNATGVKVDDAVWSEIPAGSSFVRDSWDSTQFHLSTTPTPQNSGN